MITQLLDGLSALLGVPVSLELAFTACFMACGIAFLVAYLRKRSFNRRADRQRARIVQELLLKAIDQRSTLTIEFSSEEMHGRILSGPCSSFDSDMLTVDVGLEYSLEGWRDEPVEVSFNLAYKTTNTYYAFSSRILSMRTGPWAVSMNIALPSHIQPMQKRRYVRIVPLQSHILGIGLWPLDPAQPLPMQSTQLGCASLSYRPGKPPQCSLRNLSAGGMRMEAPQVLLSQFSTNLTLQSHILCLLLLRSPDSEQPMPFWFACTIVSMAEDPEDASIVILGMKFRAWALAEAGASDIAWFSAGTAGAVPPLASWVLRHQLEQSRQRE